MIGFRFTRFTEDEEKPPFERMLGLFLELLTYTSGDVDEAIDWLRQIDDEHDVSGDDYSVDEFIQELEDRGYFAEPSDGGSGRAISAKTEQAIRKRALEQIFGKLKKSTPGQHKTNFSGSGSEQTELRRKFKFGDKLENVDFTSSLKNAQINHGIGNFNLTEDDLEVIETEHKSMTATVLMIDISHSMILYGEDRITPAKKVAMALSELIMQKYPKDTLDIVVFGNDAWQVSVKDLPYLQVGPYHTNTVAGLELAMDILRRKKTSNKQVFMITDGKPSCIKENGEYYMNSWGLDPHITTKCFNLAKRCRKLNIPITTFMIATDSYLQQFVETFTEANNGRAFYTGLQGLSDTIFEDFERNRRRKI